MHALDLFDCIQWGIVLLVVCSHCYGVIKEEKKLCFYLYVVIATELLKKKKIMWLSIKGACISVCLRMCSKKM